MKSTNQSSFNQLFSSANFAAKNSDQSPTSGKYTLNTGTIQQHIPRFTKNKVNSLQDSEYPLITARCLSELNHFRAHHQYYLELPENHFVAYRDVYCAGLRALALAQLINPADILVGKSALWLHTGFVPTLMREITTARIDGRKHTGTVRKKIAEHHLMQIENVVTTTPARTAVDLLLVDLELGITALPKLIKAGTNISQIQCIAAEMSNSQGINQVRSVLRQLREVPALSAIN